MSKISTPLSPLFLLGTTAWNEIKVYWQKCKSIETCTTDDSEDTIDDFSTWDTYDDSIENTSDDSTEDPAMTILIIKI